MVAAEVEHRGAHALNPSGHGPAQATARYAVCTVLCHRQPLSIPGEDEDGEPNTVRSVAEVDVLTGLESPDVGAQPFGLAP